MMKTKKIFVGCLPCDTNTEEIALYFSKFCEISKFKVKFRSNGVCTGYGEFRTNISEKGLTELLAQEHIYKGRKLDCREYVKGPKLKSFLEDFTFRKIYVKGMPESTTDEELFEFFSQICQVEKAYIANQVRKSGNLFGFIVTENREGAQKLIELGQTQFKGYTLEISKCSSQKLESMKKKSKNNDLKKAEGNKPICVEKEKDFSAQVHLQKNRRVFKSGDSRRRRKVNRVENYLKMKDGIKLARKILPKFEHRGMKNLRLNYRQRFERMPFQSGIYCQ